MTANCTVDDRAKLGFVNNSTIHFHCTWQTVDIYKTVSAARLSYVSLVNNHGPRQTDDTVAVKTT